jgi:hypothetical protein
MDTTTLLIVARSLNALGPYCERKGDRSSTNVCTDARRAQGPAPSVTCFAAKCTSNPASPIRCDYIKGQIEHMLFGGLGHAQSSSTSLVFIRFFIAQGTNSGALHLQLRSERPVLILVLQSR